MVYSWCEKCVFLSLLMDVGHFCFTSTIQNKQKWAGVKLSLIADQGAASQKAFFFSFFLFLLFPYKMLSKDPK